MSERGLCGKEVISTPHSRNLCLRRTTSISAVTY